MQATQIPGYIWKEQEMSYYGIDYLRVQVERIRREWEKGHGKTAVHNWGIRLQDGKTSLVVSLWDATGHHDYNMVL